MYLFCVLLYLITSHWKKWSHEFSGENCNHDKSLTSFHLWSEVVTDHKGFTILFNNTELSIAQLFSVASQAKCLLFWGFEIINKPWKKWQKWQWLIQWKHADRVGPSESSITEQPNGHIVRFLPKEEKIQTGFKWGTQVRVLLQCNNTVQFRVCNQRCLNPQ